ncbi:MAG: site-specific integrase [Treponema sp.]|jgi:site-specific recombinase XerD|nr:site-specific integrase [Treponema sp.]
MINNIILSQSQAADVLSISENALNALAYSGQIPHLKITSPMGGAPNLCFNSAELVNWFNIGPKINNNNTNQITCLKKQLCKRHPATYLMLKNYDRQFVTARKSKGYNLTKVPNKKLGFIYYARYIVKGKLIPTRWSTHTNNFDAATKFAIEKKDILLAEYFQKKEGKKPPNRLYSIMKNYYAKDSQYQKYDNRRGRTLSDEARRFYHSTIHQHFIPFLKKRRIQTLEEIDAPLIVGYQDYCMDKGLKPQSVNHYVGFVKHIFDYLVQKNYLKTNPCIGVTPLRVKEESYQIRNCYNVKEMRGVFNKRWDDELSSLLCLVIYSTGMRNSEIDRIRVKDMFRINKCWFINIPKSKSRFGIRTVPLHNFVHGKLARYAIKLNKAPDDLLFCQPNGKIIPRQWYTNANIALGKFTKRDENQLQKENITFYSGRHYWKTLMNSCDLGDVEEYFMGHKISNDVAKRYNHRDKQGQGRIAQKAQAVFRILDNKLFIRRPPA